MIAEVLNISDFRPEQKKQGIVYSTDQVDVINDFLKFLDNDSQKYMSVSGPAGSGKSTIVREMLKLAASDGRRPTVLAAPTHKAAGNLREITQKSVSTIHSMLCLQQERNLESGEEIFKQNEKRFDPWDFHYSLLVIDEGSMCGKSLLDHIFKLVGTVDLKVLFIGDNAQLNPVGEPPSLALDIDKCPWPISQLTSIHRQKYGSPIIELATLLRTGEISDLNEVKTHLIDGKGVSVLPKKEWKQAVIDNCQDSSGTSRAITYTNDTADKMNETIRRFKYDLDPRNPEPYVVGELMTSHSRVQKGRDCLLENNEEVYVAEVHKTDDRFYGLEVIRLDNDRVNVRAMQTSRQRKAHLQALANKSRAENNWVAFFSERDSIADFRAGYANTAHKSQGATYRNVFIDPNELNRCQDPDERRRLLYVAVTRASHKVFLTTSS